MSSDTERIKELVDIADVIGEYIELHPAGYRYKAKCPFHNEKTPSFIVSPDRGTYHCFGCGVSGDVFSFVQEFEGLDFKGALKILAERAGIEITMFKSGVFKEKNDRLTYVLEEATKFFESKMEGSSLAKSYLIERSVTDDTSKDWRLGYAPNEWRALYDYLVGKEIPISDIKGAGLIKEKEGKTYDTFRDRVVFPIFDPSGTVIAFSGRALNPTDKAPKYLNSPDTDVFNKSEVLYGLNRASRPIRRKGYVIVVEGQFDLIMSHQIGIDNTVALSGTSVTKGHILRLKRFTNNLLLAFDSDDAGIRSSYKASALAMDEGMDVKIANLPEGKDPADCIKESKDVWKEVLKCAPHAVLHTLGYIKRSISEDRKRIKAVQEYTFPLLALVKSEMDRSYFINSIAEEMGVPLDNVRSDIERYIDSSSTVNDRIDMDDDHGLPEMSSFGLGKRMSRSESAVELLAILFNWLESSSNSVYPVERLRSQVYSVDSEFAERVSEYKVDPESSKEVLDMEIRFNTIDISGIISYSDELVYQYKTAKLEELISDIKDKIKESSSEGNVDGENLLEYQKLSRELHDIRAKRHKGEVRYVVE